MIRRDALNVLVLVAAVVLFSGSSAFAQAKKHPSRAKTAPAAAKDVSSQQMTNLGFGVPESMSGSIQMVVADQNLLVVKGPNGVPYDLRITPKTVIVVGDKAGALETLAGQIGKQVSVGFVPQRDGNFATRIEVSD
ncbi:MAG: hypothetical protein KGL59_05730 [Acidobacteriota bacterium]|nr:hypothetical protein [Acidobacteriota bacterium]